MNLPSIPPPFRTLLRALRVPVLLLCTPISSACVADAPASDEASPATPNALKVCRPGDEVPCDPLPPPHPAAVTSVYVDGQTSTSAVLHFRTPRGAVQTTVGLYQAMTPLGSPLQSLRDSAPTVDHVMVIGNLQPCSAYHFDVTIAGVDVYSSDDFATAGIAASDIDAHWVWGEGTARIAFTTPIASDAAVSLAGGPGAGSQSDTGQRQHSFTFTGLSANTTYTYSVSPRAVGGCSAATGSLRVPADLHSAWAIDMGAPVGTVAEAKRTFAKRANAALQFEACEKHYWLKKIDGDEDNFVINATARLAVDGTCPGELQDNRSWVSDMLLASNVSSKIGTTWGGPCPRTGEYDVALRGLVRIVYQFGDRISFAAREHVINDLLTVSGPHDSSVEHVDICGVSVQETENHLLQIESSRYLTNQLLLARTGNPRFDNAANGMNDWMLRELQSILQYDFVEYGARPYQAYAIPSIENLYDFAADPRVRTAAQMVLDYHAAKFAVSSSMGRRAGPFRRRDEFQWHKGLLDDHVDFSTYRFALYAGITARLDAFDPPFHANAYGNDIALTAVSGYRPPDVVLDLAMHKDRAPYYQRFYGGKRAGSDPLYPNVVGGPELYASSPSFLLSAGGFWVEPVYGGSDEGVSIETTLMPTARGVDRSEFLRIDGASLPHVREIMNTCVAPGFACGLNVEIPASFRRIQSGNFTFVDGYATGFYAAVYSENCGSDGTCYTAASGGSGTEGNFGFFEVAEARPGQTLAEFRDAVLSRNASSGFGAERVNEYVTTDGRHIRFTPNAPYADGSGNKYHWGIVSIDATAFNTDISHWPLAQGDVINSDGHSGAMSIRNPAFPGATCWLDLSTYGSPFRSCPDVVEISIDKPGASDVYTTSGTVNFHAYVVDRGTGATTTWTSDVDGVLGVGTSLSYTFGTPGPRVITAVASDGGISAQSTQRFNVHIGGPIIGHLPF